MSFPHVPFDASHQLYDKLVTGTAERPDDPGTLTATTVRRVAKHGQGQFAHGSLKDYLPGVPRLQLRDPDISQYLRGELLTEELDKLSPCLWLVAKQDSSHISSLTEQLVRGRQVCITENPGLHLVWYYDRVFIKPIPKYLLSHAFWEFYLQSPESPIDAALRAQLFRAALGFLRSYNHLIRHKSDFALAMREDCRLLPKNAKYANFTRLVQSFADVDDGAVSLRYKFGELRLSRLNFWAKVYLFRFTYFKATGQYGAYFARCFGPILFVFAVFSVLLSAMQVALAAQPPAGLESGSWSVFSAVSRGFSVFTIVSAVATLGGLFLVLFGMISRETIFACKDLYRHRRLKKLDTKEDSSS